MTREKNAINRLIDAKEGYKEYLTDEAIDIAIEAIEQTMWIPVSERLPETNDDVLVYDGADMYVAWYWYMKQGWNSADYAFDKDTPIIAWMPLPEPYEL